MECLLVGDSFEIFKKGQGEAAIQATFGAEGLSFEDGKDRVFVSLRADESQMGKLQINDYQHKIYAAVTAEDFAKLQPAKTK